MWCELSGGEKEKGREENVGERRRMPGIDIKMQKKIRHPGGRFSPISISPGSACSAGAHPSRWGVSDYRSDLYGASKGLKITHDTTTND
jgi:hypothetical protein